MPTLVRPLSEHSADPPNRCSVLAWVGRLALAPQPTAAGLPQRPLRAPRSTPEDPETYPPARAPLPARRAPASRPANPALDLAVAPAYLSRSARPVARSYPRETATAH